MQHRTAQQQSAFTKLLLAMRPGFSPLSADAQTLRDKLHHQLAEVIAVMLVLIKTPFDLLAFGIFWYTVPPETPHVVLLYIVHTINIISVGSLTLLLLRRQRPRAALLVAISINIVSILSVVWIISNPGPALSMALLLVLPATVLRTRTVLLFGVVFNSALLALGYSGGNTAEINFPGLFTLNLSVVVSALLIGYGVQRGLDSIARLVTRREAEAIERTRLEEKSRVLEQHHQRLLAVQHDLRAPCNTAIRITQLIQDPTVDQAIAQSFTRRLEPLLLQLRTRIDALLDEAKMHSLTTTSAIPLIDLSATVAAYVPELQRWARLRADMTEQAEAPVLLFDQQASAWIHARAGEIQRILENIVLNSVAAEARHVTIQVVSVAGRHVELCVQDDGKGFPAWVLARETPTSPTYRAQGFGLGLAGVTANVALFGGSVVLENREHGAQVRITFPIGDAP